MKKILILTANPKNTDELRLNEEVREIQEGLQRSRSRDQFEIIVKWAVRPKDLLRALLDHEPQIVHFSGHGAGCDGLVLESEDGQMKLVSTKALVDLFGLFKKTVECVVLNACYSEVQAVAIYQHIDYVIGMGQAIGDRAAIDFAVGFYDALGADRGYAEAFEFGLTAIGLEEISETATPKLKQRSYVAAPAVPETAPILHSMPECTTMDVESEFYVERSTDAVALSEIERLGGVTMTIKGPRQIGKSSLLMRTLARAKQIGKQVVYFDFQELDRSIFQDSNRFYQQFCTLLTTKLNRPEALLDLSAGRNFSCGRYVESEILSRLLGRSLVLAMDKVEMIFGTEFQSDFFAMLRSWHNKRAITPLWKKLDLVMVTSMEPYQLISDLNLSPFNVGRIIDIEDFNTSQVVNMNQRYNYPLNQQQLQQLTEFLSGHPYLTRYSLDLLATNRTTMLELLDQSTTYGGHFDNHFQMFRLDGQPELRRGMLEVIRHQRCTNEEVFFSLLSAGLVSRKGNRVVPRCQLYNDYFREHLND